MIAPHNLDCKGPTRSNRQYFVVDQPLDWRYGYNVDILISIDINDNFVVLIKGVEQDSDLGLKIDHPSLDDESEATDSDKEENNNENDPETP